MRSNGNGSNKLVFRDLYVNSVGRSHRGLSQKEITQKEITQDANSRSKRRHIMEISWKGIK